MSSLRACLLLLLAYSTPTSSIKLGRAAPGEGLSRRGLLARSAALAALPAPLSALAAGVASDGTTVRGVNEGMPTGEKDVAKFLQQQGFPPLPKVNGLSPLVQYIGAAPPANIDGSKQKERAFDSTLLVKFLYPSGWLVETPTLTENGEAGKIAANNYLKGEPPPPPPLHPAGGGGGSPCARALAQATLQTLSPPSSRPARRSSRLTRRPHCSAPAPSLALAPGSSTLLLRCAPPSLPHPPLPPRPTGPGGFPCAGLPDHLPRLPNDCRCLRGCQGAAAAAPAALLRCPPPPASSFSRPALAHARAPRPGAGWQGQEADRGRRHGRCLHRLWCARKHFRPSLAHPSPAPPPHLAAPAYRHPSLLVRPALVAAPVAAPAPRRLHAADARRLHRRPEGDRLRARRRRRHRRPRDGHDGAALQVPRGGPARVHRVLPRVRRQEARLRLPQRRRLSASIAARRHRSAPAARAVRRPACSLQCSRRKAIRGGRPSVSLSRSRLFLRPDLACEKGSFLPLVDQTPNSDSSCLEPSAP